MPATANTRHAVSRSTGATTWTRKEGDGWKTTCLSHKAETTAPNRSAAWKNGSAPAQFCPKCNATTEGKAEKLPAGLLGLPTPTKKAAPNKPTTAKKAASPKPTKAA
jgi:hypothetical protein